MAGRIPESFIHDLLARTDIVEVIGSRLELKRAGKEFKARSPFTNEKTPSFYVNPAKQMFFDFSSGKNGTAVSFLMEYDRLTFVEAIEELARKAGVDVPREGGTSERLVLDGPLDALAAAERFFKAQLRTHQPAIDYLKQRGIAGETAQRFGIGYAPESWDALTQQFNDSAHALTAGLLIKKDSGGCYDRFRNRIMFPIRDTRGRVIAFGGRTLANDPAKYLNSPETPLFHKGRNLYGLYEARQSSNTLRYLLVVEGYMDAVMLVQHGIPEVAATLGTATTREHLNLLFKSTSKVVFCFDGDRAGRSAGWRALEQALPEVYEGRECQFMFLPESHDPDTLVQEIGAEEFRTRVEQAQPLSVFLIGELSKQVSLASADGRARLATLAQPYLARLREGPLRSLMLDELVKLTRLSREDLERARPAKVTVSPEPAESEVSAARPVKRTLQLLLEQPRLAAEIKSPDLLAASGVPGVSVLVQTLDYFRANPSATVAQLLELRRDTPEGRALQRLAATPTGLSEEAGQIQFTRAIAQFRLEALREHIEGFEQAARLRNLTEAELQAWNQATREFAKVRSTLRSFEQNTS